MPYIGSIISLISKTGVRYEGTLYTIDMVESTIALQNGIAKCSARRSVKLCPAMVNKAFVCSAFFRH